MTIFQNAADKKKIPILAYIASDVRSGSTLLDMLLGNHPQVESVGEIQFLTDHFQRKGTGYSWDWLCTCGKKFDDCQFWTKINDIVEKKSGQPIKALETWVKRCRQFFPLITLPSKRLVSLGKSFFSVQQGLDAARNCWNVIDAIYKITGKNIIVDSSKTAEQFRFLYLLRPESMRMIHLVRDGRGVIYSKMTRAGDSARKASKTWVFENLKILFVKALIPKQHKISLSYEDLCRNPQYEIDKILRFLNLPQRKISLSKYDRHNVGGSPHRFDYGNTEIKVDERWKHNLMMKDKNVFRVVGGWLNLFFGYR